MLKTDILNRFRYKSINTVKHMKNLVYPHATILMYHRVAQLDSDPWSLAVTPKHFAEHLEIISKHGNPLSLQELTIRLNNNKSVKKAIIITFDDGYADNLCNAKPLLEKYDIPATIFVVTSKIDSKNEFWWDELDRLILQSDNLPDHLQLDIQGKKHRWEIEEALKFHLAGNHRNINYKFDEKQLEYPHWRYALYQDIYQLLRPLPAQDRLQLINELRAWTNTNYESRNNYRCLTSEELIKMDQSTLIDIGAHTVSHAFLPELPIALQEEEIQQCKNYLENLLGRSVNSFAYPHGDYTADTISIVKKAGFECACSCNHKRVKQNSCLFALPRINVTDCNGEEFARLLSFIEQ